LLKGERDPVRTNRGEDSDEGGGSRPVTPSRVLKRKEIGCQKKKPSGISQTEPSLGTKKSMYWKNHAKRENQNVRCEQHRNYKGGGEVKMQHSEVKVMAGCVLTTDYKRWEKTRGEKQTWGEDPRTCTPNKNWTVKQKRLEIQN